MAPAVIISTYNQPQWLELSLEGWKHQTLLPAVIIIADDGSDSRTAEIVRRCSSSLPIRHVWHKDLGFRKTEILNKAVRLANTLDAGSPIDYLVFTDGDCIPRNDFLETHIRNAKRGRFLSGGYHKVPRISSNAITLDIIERQECFTLKWLRTHGMPFSLRNTKVAVRGLSAKLSDALTTTRPTFNGHNTSAWMADILNANGFDTRMKYGGEDRELGERLENAGVKGLGIRYRAICLHLDHDRSYVNDTDIKYNNDIRSETTRSRLTRTLYGIDQLNKSV
ncbi:MAG: glycosyltransferase family 2 protein [Ignavibacteria bacterium]|nr:glycosyltransferase family 2 protein [Ignavibacteria bacterium]